MNNQAFAGYDDWRLPTLEEAMSLVEPKNKYDDLYIEAVFGKNQQYIWTADKARHSLAWCVNFNTGYSFHPQAYVYDARAVRSGTLTM